ncbi:HU family DNA-binding protein [Bacillus infantis]|uniref:HU family DNA-binding protein n=1 Tax=Bacillus infantis TaxID=324767 RepID=UPI00101B823B|nr:HU family DNA-binding protein [Bacillus infantis]RYI30595.1 HU family DNA-binding protein [Bacillus infantis]
MAANKTDLVGRFTELAPVEFSNKKEATETVEALLEAVVQLLKEHGKVQLIGFGNFEVRERAARKGRNPQTGDEIEIAASKVPAFKPGKALKDEFK